MDHDHLRHQHWVRPETGTHQRKVNLPTKEEEVGKAIKAESSRRREVIIEKGKANGAKAKVEKESPKPITLSVQMDACGVHRLCHAEGAQTKTTRTHAKYRAHTM